MPCHHRAGGDWGGEGFILPLELLCRLSCHCPSNKLKSPSLVVTAPSSPGSETASDSHHLMLVSLPLSHRTLN